VSDDVVLGHSWQDLRGPGDAERRQVQAVTDELLREVSPGHAMYGTAFTIIGRSPWSRRGAAQVRQPMGAGSSDLEREAGGATVAGVHHFRFRQRRRAGHGARLDPMRTDGGSCVQVIMTGAVSRGTA
jgi:hypothetical protein